MSIPNRIAVDISNEIARNDRNWPNQTHMPDGLEPDDIFPIVDLHMLLTDARKFNDNPDNPASHGPIFLEEALEAMTAPDQENLRTELVQTCAVAIRWIADIDSRSQA